MKWKRFLGNEDGAVIVIAALAFIMVIVLSGIVIDLGSAYIEGSSLQNAADSAAYAAGAKLPVAVDDTAGIAQVTGMAAEYAQKNGIDGSEVAAVELENIVGGKYYGVRVRLQSEVSYSFGPIIGIDGTTVTKGAKVMLEPTTSSTTVVPLGIEASRLAEVLAYIAEQDVIIKYGGGGGTEGFFGALDLDGVQGGGAKDFESWLAFGYDGVLKMGDTLPVESGNMAGPTTDAFTLRYNQCTHFPSQGGCNEIQFNSDCPRVVTIIVYSFVDQNTVKVEGFIPFVLKGLNGNGEIVASKTTIITYEGETNGTLGGAGDYGIYRARLVE